ncbi:MAG TPA: SGNH/GDSL hydrolase family protein [Planctomycetota bacterium]
MQAPKHGEAGGLARLLFAAAGLLALLALLADPEIVGRFHFRRPLSSEARAETARSRWAFALTAAVLGAAGWAVGRRGLAPAATRAALASLAVGLPLLVLERASRPFVERLTTLFVPDPELGWRHRPGAEDTYWGEPVRLNAHGQRGPERAPARTPGATRVLVLGDSVAFGLLVADDADTFPARLEGELGARLARPVECLNTGVAGWSTRQERQFLEREGARWRPDLVLLAFVLNDVTEPTGARAVGQFAYARPEGMPAWLAECGIHLALRELALRRALAGDSPAARAHQERLTPYHLMLQPDTARVQAAWRALLPELAALQAWSTAQAVPLAVVVFPHGFQLGEPAADAPQRLLAGFAAQADLPLLDLLPAFVAAAAGGELFLDALHPSARGHALAAAETARFLVERALLR